MIIDEEVAPVEPLPFDSSLLAQVIEPRRISLADDQSTRVEASKIETARVHEHGTENDENEEEESRGETQGDLNFAARWRFGSIHGLMCRLTP